MFKYLRYAACLLAIVSFTACGDDDELDEPTGSNETGSTNQTMTPEQSKEYLESVAKEVLNMFKPADQEATINFLTSFEDRYGDLEEPENWDDDYMSPTYMVRNLRRALSRADFTSMSRAFYTYTWDFEHLSGVYEPGMYRWVKTAESKYIIFKCTVDGQATEFKAEALGGSNDAVTVRDEYSNEQWMITAPKKIVFTATQGATTHINATVEASFKENESVNLNVNAQAANLRAEAVLTATNSKINETTKGYVSNAWLTTAVAQVDGVNMCKRAEIKRIIDADNDSERNRLLDNMFKKGVANADVLGKVQLKCTVTGLSDLLEIDSYFDTYEYATKEECLQACKKSCSVLNNNVSAKMYYNGNSTLQGWLSFAPSKFYSWGSNSGEYEIEALIEFTDKSTYSLDDYFNDTDFSGVTKLWESLVNSYERLWD